MLGRLCNCPAPCENEIFCKNIYTFIIGFIIYSFLFGKLFPYSPVIVGFTKNELSNTVIYIQKGAEYRDLKTINDLIPFVEKFHELKFIKKQDYLFLRIQEVFINAQLPKQELPLITMVI
jgi:hypothetical protein